MARAVDGSIVIGAKLDTSKFAKELERLQNKLSNQEADLNMKLIDIEGEERKLGNINSDLEETKRKEEEIKQKIAEQYAIKEKADKEGNKEVSIKSLETLSALYDELDPVTNKVLVLLDKQNEQLDVISKQYIMLDKQTDAIEQTEIEIDRTKEAMEEASKIDMTKTIKKMSNSLEKVSKKISRLGLTLLGVQTIYGMMTSAISRIKEDNKDFASFMQTISNMFDIIVSHLIAEILPTAKELLPTVIEIANIILNVVMALVKLLLPVIKFVINAVKWLADQLGLIASDWFGIDMSVNNFSEGLDKANKKASKLRKQLMGFDEMNILNKDTGSTGVISGLSGLNVDGTISPKNKDWLAIDDDFISGLKIGAGAIADDMLELFYAEEMKELEKIIEGAILNGRIKEENGIVKIITATGQAIQFTKEEYDALVQDIVKGKIPASHKALWEKAKSILQAKDVKVFLKSLNSASKLAQEGLKDAVVTYKDGMVEVKLSTGETLKFTEDEWERLKKKLLKEGKETKDEIIAYIDEISGATNSNTNGILDGLQSDIDRWKKNFKGNIKDATYTYRNGMYEINLANGETIKLNEEQWKSFQAYLKLNNIQIVQDNKNSNKDIKQSTKEGVDGVKDEYEGLPDWLKDNVLVELLKEFGILGGETGQTFGKSLKDAVNKVLEKIEATINNMFATATNLYKKFGINLPAPKLKIPRLARGGIINQAGRGVYVGGAIAGERGREAVVPLTDSQQMALLGREIARNVVINLTNVTELDGRQIARSVTQVMNDMNFASNGGVI